MANHAEYAPVLQAIATDYGGVSVAALNLSVRCSVTAVDLCGAALGRLTGLSTTAREFDAHDIRRRCVPVALTEQRLVPLATAYLARVSARPWLDIEDLRNEATHRLYERGVYGAVGPMPDPRPLAYPQQIDIAHNSWGMQPLDQLAAQVTGFAEDTFREFCEALAALA